MIDTHTNQEEIMVTESIARRNITVKTVCDLSGNLPRTVLAPKSIPGDNADKSVQVRRILNVPESVSDISALLLFEQTVDFTGFGGRQRRFEFDYAELGAGKIIR